MDWEFVTLEKNGRVAIVRFDRGHKANAISRQLMDELTAAARSFEGDFETSVIVLAGRDDAFSMGRDLNDPRLANIDELGLAERRKAIQAGPRLTKAWEDVEPITIAAIDGWCVGGGTALAVACDFRVMASTAHMYVPEVERGFNMSWQSVPRIVNLIGPAKTKRLIVLAEKLDAEKALAWGLTDEVSDGAGALSAACKMAERIASMPPVQVRMVKQGINAYANALSHATSVMDADQFALAFTSEDRQEGVEAFLEGRDPVYSGK